VEFLKEFRNPELARKALEAIRRLSTGPVRLMEVCGTHTTAISRSGLRELLPETLTLLSGPGCPVCVTPTSLIDVAIEFVKKKQGVLATFGDLIRVPGSESSLESEIASGADVRIVYSVLDALELARKDPATPVIFFAVGFETTSPSIACAVDDAASQGIDNFFVIPAHKIIPPAMEALLASGEVRVDGFICPGHVSTIIGSGPYEFIPERYRIPCVIAGFEPFDVLQAIIMILEQIASKKPRVEIEYARLVKARGNPKALDKLFQVFEPEDSDWRGLGTIPKSGLRLREPYRRFDAIAHFGLTLKPAREPEHCRCGEVLRGLVTPYECRLFGSACMPAHPVGACMVSSEGTCAAYFKYSRRSRR